ncbi:unnamed protein product [Pieris macdunnoughi]|uniref:ABC transporter domain-containing protein n=1 Tax=Pieris macdunnoughi TaxID=345717 RepID=A0A821YR90_9NEOP|nr:unnamed protein product [Pieris macdunnoughi]
MATPAVVVERASKYYGKKGGNDYKPVLQNLDMTVERGTIYGLLGASGCGKTTLLSCIVGRRHLDSGNIWVLGGKPGEKGSGVPGPRVGYMPQDIALVAEFTIRDALYYFGRIYGMSNKLLAERYDFLCDLLELPAGDSFTSNCQAVSSDVCHWLLLWYMILNSLFLMNLLWGWIRCYERSKSSLLEKHVSWKMYRLF